MKKEIEIKITVPNQTRYLSLIGRIGEAMARELDRYAGDREALAYHLNVVLTEAMANAIQHGSAVGPENEIHVRITMTANELTLRVYDKGQGFNIEALQEPVLEPELLEKGRGIFIIKSLMDSVTYKKTSSGNVLVMKKGLG